MLLTAEEEGVPVGVPGTPPNPPTGRCGKSCGRDVAGVDGCEMGCGGNRPLGG